MEGVMERGGLITPTCAADRRQQQSGSRHNATPPPTARGGRQPCGPRTAPPPAVHAGRDRAGLTVQQQQQRTPASPPTASLLARHALNLYNECVAAGQWARINIVQHLAGETISFSSRPMAAAPAAVWGQGRKKSRRVRRPNEKRRAKKKLWQQSRGNTPAVGQRQQERPCSQQLLRSEPQPSSAACESRQQQQSTDVVLAATAAARGSYAAAVATAAFSAAEEATIESASPAAGSSVGGDRPVVSPKLTRARKRLRGIEEAFVQLDGVESSPPPSPDGLMQPVSISIQCEDLKRGAGDQEPAGSPETANPPPPPPWSRFLPSHVRTVICKYCLAGCHGLGFQSCSRCFDSGKLS